MRDNQVGIWGFGIVGKAAAQFLLKENAKISVMTRNLTKKDMGWLAEKNIPHFSEDQKDYFLEQNDYILPSPGIDIRHVYNHYREKWLCELDLFQSYFHKPIIAITGSVGKTTVTSLLTQILHNYGWRVAAGGNIGIACLDLIEQQDSLDAAVLEVSSFQLEYCKSFAPDLAIITNIVPNHLDRHGSMENYLYAKVQILLHQKGSQKVLAPLELAPRLRSIESLHDRPLNLFVSNPSQNILKNMHADDTLFLIDSKNIILNIKSNYATLAPLKSLPLLTFPENWLIICAALHMLGLPLEKLGSVIHNLSLPEHRLEKVATMHGIDFYNDSKSTTSASTLAAVKQLQNNPVILFLGGLSKGIDREPLIEALRNKVKTIYCFGAEAPALHLLCKQHNIPSKCFSNLDDAFHACTLHLQSDDCVLFSPAGSSFDLFRNYQERGNHFKQLVQSMIN